jgi:hypothetical protein
MAEIRARDLAFNREETECFLGEQGLALSDPPLGRLLRGPASGLGQARPIRTESTGGR